MNRNQSSKLESVRPPEPGNKLSIGCLLLTVVLGVLLGRPLAGVAQTNEEEMLIQVLQSNPLPKEKDAACARLKIIGTVQCVPALSALLYDVQLSHSARYALESMPLAEAGQALVAALDKTSGLTKIGIINSLGLRTEKRAVPALTKLLPAAQEGRRRQPAAVYDPAVAAAAARALGQITTPDAIKALQVALKNSIGAVHDAVAEGLLRCANQLLISQQLPMAKSIFQRLYDSERTDSLRVAAYRGVILASDRQALSLEVKAIPGEPGPKQTAALEFVQGISAPGATGEFARLLPKLEPPVQIAVIGGLARRNDPSAAAAIGRFTTSKIPEVRIAAIRALGTLGDASTILNLAESASISTGDEQKAARQALIDLRRGNVAEAMAAYLTTSQPAVQSELARALGERREKEVVPELFLLAVHQSGSARRASLQALSVLVDQSQLAALVQLVISAKIEAARLESAEAVNSAAQHLLTTRGRLDASPIIEGLGSSSTEARMALLPVCSGLADQQVRVALRKALSDPSPQVQTAALRAACETIDPELLPDLLTLATDTQQATFRTLAIAACVRLTKDEVGRLSISQRLTTLSSILATRLRPDQTRQVLAGLAEVPDLRALKLVLPRLADTEVQNEAARAGIRIATALPPSETRDSLEALKRIVAASSDAATRQEAEVALKNVQDGLDSITMWQVAGPYRQEDKDCTALFDVRFSPERSETQQNVKWKVLPPSGDSKRPWVMNLQKSLRGEQRVAYARTWIHSPQEQPARLEIGSDDGLKVWWNDKLVHTNNVIRNLQPRSDRLSITLNQGWNALLLKLTHHTQRWEFCAHFLKPDGSHLEGLQVEADPEKVRPPQTKQ